MPSLFDLFHVPQRKKSTMNPAVSLAAAETAFPVSEPVHHGDAATVRVQMEPMPGVCCS